MDTESELLMKDALIASAPVRVTLTLALEKGSYSLMARGDKDRVERVLISVQRTFHRQRMKRNRIGAALASVRLCAKRGIALTLEIE